LGRCGLILESYTYAGGDTFCSCKICSDVYLISVGLLLRTGNHNRSPSWKFSKNFLLTSHRIVRRAS